MSFSIAASLASFEHKYRSGISPGKSEKYPMGWIYQGIYISMQVQEGKAHGAVATPGAAYGASALGPSAGIGAGVGAGAPSSNPQTEAELHQQPMPSLNPGPGPGPKQASTAMHDSNAEQDQRGL